MLVCYRGRRALAASSNRVGITIRTSVAARRSTTAVVMATPTISRLAKPVNTSVAPSLYLLVFHSSPSSSTSSISSIFSISYIFQNNPIHVVIFSLNADKIGLSSWSRFLALKNLKVVTFSNLLQAWWRMTWSILFSCRNYSINTTIRTRTWNLKRKLVSVGFLAASFRFFGFLPVWDSVDFLWFLGVSFTIFKSRANSLLQGLYHFVWVVNQMCWMFLTLN